MTKQKIYSFLAALFICTITWSSMVIVAEKVESYLLGLFLITIPLFSCIGIIAILEDIHRRYFIKYFVRNLNCYFRPEQCDSNNPEYYDLLIKGVLNNAEYIADFEKIEGNKISYNLSIRPIGIVRTRLKDVTLELESTNGRWKIV